MIASDEYLMDCYCGTGEQQTKSGFDWVLHYFHQHGQEFDHAAASETPDMFR